jgi:hypothetical protein
MISPSEASPFRREFLRAVCQQAGIRGWEFAGWYAQVRGKPFTVLEDSDVKPLLDAAYARAEDRRLGRHPHQNALSAPETPSPTSRTPETP